ncbi:MAG: CPBP family intramembrane metalloprotease [Oscillospiraceae bacterium]|nr:CPBP family intramembrane metalloprotease [Oscillospiraceae bacterium]
MANARSNSIGPRLSKAQTIAGLLYLPFYVFLLSWALTFAADLLQLSLTDLQHNACWFVLNALIVWCIFSRFLIRSFRAIRFWDLVQAVILGFVMYYAGNYVFNFLMDLFAVNITSFNDITMTGLASENYWVMVLCSVIIAPVVEETLVRGLIFGALRPHSRVAAYAVSIVFFSLMHVWSYVPSAGLIPVLLAALQYLPASIALGWTYEKSDTIWGPIFLHMIANAITMSLL